MNNTLRHISNNKKTLEIIEKPLNAYKIDKYLFTMILNHYILEAALNQLNVNP